jgi:4-diphosphocytidyl-2-C-methyl-D-erythritol kinase
MPTWESSRVVEAKAPAKVNLFLEVTGKRPDGYHEISSVAAPVSLFDELTFEKAAGIELDCDNPELPTDESNLVVKAASLLKDRYDVRGGVRVSLRKRIPVSAGLGGGSSNAAAAIVALNDLWELGLTHGEMISVAADTGSDVALFLCEGVVHMRGRGERVSLVENNLPELCLVLAVPPFGLSTADVYSRVRVPDAQHRKSASGMIEGFLNGDWELIARNTYNRLQEAAFRAEPRLEELFEGITRATTLPVRMSGSGSAFFVCCESQGESADVSQLLEEIEGIQVVEALVLKRGPIGSAVGKGR